MRVGAAGQAGGVMEGWAEKGAPMPGPWGAASAGSLFPHGESAP